MATRLPAPGSDNGTWGDILNEFLLVEHTTTGELRQSADIQTALDTAQSTQASLTTLQADVTPLQSSVATLQTDLIDKADTIEVLAKTNNLSDVASVPTTRANLGLGSAATQTIPSSGNASSNQVVIGNDTRLTDHRTPIDGSITDVKVNGTLSQSKITNLETDLQAKFDKTGGLIGGNISLPTSAYVNYGSSSGLAGYGLRDNAGTIEYKNTGGSWVPLNTSTTTPAVLSNAPIAALRLTTYGNTGQTFRKNAPLQYMSFNGAPGGDFICNDIITSLPFAATGDVAAPKVFSLQSGSGDYAGQPVYLIGIVLTVASLDGTQFLKASRDPISPEVIPSDETASFPFALSTEAAIGTQLSLTNDGGFKVVTSSPNVFQVTLEISLRVQLGNGGWMGN